MSIITRLFRSNNLIKNCKTSLTNAYAILNDCHVSQQNITYDYNVPIRNFSLLSKQWGGKSATVNTVFIPYRCKQKSSRDDAHSDEDSDDSDDDADLAQYSEAAAGKTDNSLVKMKTTSTRMDAIIKGAIGLSRGKVEAKFFDSRIRVNGKRAAKKAQSLKVGDEVDIIKGISPKNPNHLIVIRIEILEIKVVDEKIVIIVRRYKSYTIENYPGADAFTGIFEE